MKPAACFLLQRPMSFLAWIWPKMQQPADSFFCKQMQGSPVSFPCACPHAWQGCKPTSPCKRLDSAPLSLSYSVSFQLSHQASSWHLRLTISLEPARLPAVSEIHLLCRPAGLMLPTSPPSWTSSFPTLCTTSPPAHHQVSFWTRNPGLSTFSFSIHVRLASHVSFARLLHTHAAHAVAIPSHHQSSSWVGYKGHQSRGAKGWRRMVRKKKGAKEGVGSLFSSGKEGFWLSFKWV